MLAGLLLLALVQTEWTPPSRQMPEMPAAAELGGGWRGSLGAWFRGVDFSLDQIRAMGEGGGARPRFVRYSADMRPVEQWSDRNGDGGADLIELFRDGALSSRLIDADYDGSADLLHSYDRSGALAREVRY
jgi:hypothetical protein